MIRISLFTLLFISACLLPSSVYAQNGFIDLDTAFISISDCEAGGDLCISGFSQSAALNHHISVDGIEYSGQIQGCDFDTISAYTYSTLFGQGNLGPYHLDDWTVNGVVFTGIFQNIPDLVDSMNLWDPMGNWTLDQGSLLITGGFPANTYTDMDVTVIAIQSPSFIGYNFGLDAQGTLLNFETGFHEVILTNNNTNASDTFYVHISCINPATVFIQMQPGQTGQYCPDLSELYGNILTVSNVCPDASGSAAGISAQLQTFCYDLVGLEIGQDTACLVACDDFGFCDTTTLIVSVVDVNTGLVAEIITDDIYVGNIIQYCLDTTELVSGIVSMENICPQGPESPVNFILEAGNWCVTYEAIEMGADTACIVLTNQQGVTDTAYFYSRQPRYPIPPHVLVDCSLIHRCRGVLYFYPAIA